jgi:hypothetical protein
MMEVGLKGMSAVLAERPTTRRRPMTFIWS